MRKTHTIEEMKEIAKERGGECLSEEYVNAYTKLKFKCKEGHEFFMKYQSIQWSKQWCSHCFYNKIKSTIEEMKEIARERGGECLSKEYVNAHTKLKWKCTKGHEWESTPNDIINKSWCPQCAIIKRANLHKLTIEQMKQLAITRGGICLSEEYVNAHTKLKWKCKEGHEWFSAPYSIKSRKSWCPDCAKCIKLTIEQMKQIAKEKGGECLSEEYINIATKLKWRCKERHEWAARPQDIKRGCWCPDCLNFNNEKYCRKIFEELFKVKFGKGRHKWLKYKKLPLELDGINNTIITPLGFGVAFEYNGEQHYKVVKYFNNKEFLSERKKYDKFKVKKCKEKGILLIVIPYTIKYNKIKDYILQELEKNGVLLTSVKLQKKLTDYQ
jgi:hypothetical protein